MILHDGNCAEFKFEHSSGYEPNDEVWNVPSREQWLVPLDIPVSGWRFTVIHHVGGEVIHAGGLNGDNPSPWPGLLAAPQAECEPARMIKRGLGTDKLTTSMLRGAFHGDCPAPGCECGYRIVRDVGELTRYMRWQPWVVDDYPVSDLPDGVRELVEPWGDTVTQSVVIASVVGCGLVAASDFDEYNDPTGTVRVEWLGSSGRFLVAKYDPVAEVLRNWGAEVVVVDDLVGVHEPGSCGSLDECFQLWK